MVLNLLLKLNWSGVNELSGDEPFTVYWAQRPIGELFGMLRTENNPPLYFLLIHAWANWVPPDAAWLRIPSVIFSSLTVWPLFLLGKRLGGLGVGLTAALLFTFSQHQFHFAHEVRAYPLLVLACTWSAWQLLRLASIPPGARAVASSPFIWFVASNVLATWSHYFGWLMVGLELVLVLLVPFLRPARRPVMAALGATVVLNLPMVGVLLSRAGTSLGHGTWVAPPDWEEPYNMLMRWSNAPVVAVLFLLLLVVALLRRDRGPLAFAGLWCGVPLIGMFLVSFAAPMYVDRYLLFASIGYYLLVAQAALRAAPRSFPAWVLPAGCVLAMAVTFSPWKDTGLHPSRAVAQVKKWTNGNTAVLIQPAWYGLSFAWALNPENLRGPQPVEELLREQGVIPVPGAQLPGLDTAAATVIHVDAWASLVDPGAAVLLELRKKYTQVDSVEADKKVMVRLFRKR